MYSQELLDYDFKNVSYETREYIEKNDNEMDVWINLERSRNQQELWMLKKRIVDAKFDFVCVPSLRTILDPKIYGHHAWYIFCLNIHVDLHF